MPPSGAIALTNILVIPALLVIGWLLLRLWKRGRWGAYGFGLVVIVLIGLVAFGASTFLHAAGGPASPLFYALMALAGYMALAAPVYLVVGLILLVARKATMRRAPA